MVQIGAELNFIYSKAEMAQMRATERRQIEEEKRYRMQTPRMRLPWRIRKGEIIRVLVKIRHPSRTGLRPLRDGSFEFGRPAFFIRLVEVFYGGELVAKFETTSAISDDPIFGFHLKADKEAPVRVVFTNHRSDRSEMLKEIKFSAD